MPEICPVCNLPCDSEHNSEINSDTYHCDRCSSFTITFEARNMLETWPAERKTVISGYLREKTVLREPRTVLTTDLLEVIQEQAVPTTVPLKVYRLLLNLTRISRSPEQVISVNTEMDYPLGYASSVNEVWYFLRWLRAKGYINAGSDNLTGNTYTCSVSVDGWEKVSELEKPSLETENVFVAMCFCPEMTEIYNQSIKLALQDSGYNPICLVETEHNDLVDDKIIKEIRLSRFIVADLTFNRPSVYFEAGFAMGLSRPVVWTCRRGDLPDVGFDADHYNILLWETFSDLRMKLHNRVCASIGFGPRYSG